MSTIIEDDVFGKLEYFNDWVREKTITVTNSCLMPLK